MASYLLDTNDLVYRINAGDPWHGPTVAALSALRRRKQPLWLAPQILIEFRRVCTRRAGEGGLGMTPEEATRARTLAERLFGVLPETPAIYPAWKALVDAAQVQGKQVHDARLVVVCHAAGISHVLTVNVADFQRYQNIGPGITVVHPQDVT